MITLMKGCLAVIVKGSEICRVNNGRSVRLVSLVHPGQYVDTPTGERLPYNGKDAAWLCVSCHGSLARVTSRGGKTRLETKGNYALVLPSSLIRIDGYGDCTGPELMNDRAVIEQMKRTGKAG